MYYNMNSEVHTSNCNVFFNALSDRQLAQKLWSTDASLGVEPTFKKVVWGKTCYSPVTMNIIKSIGRLGSIDPN